MRKWQVFEVEVFLSADSHHISGYDFPQVELNNNNNNNNNNNHHHAQTQETQFEASSDDKRYELSKIFTIRTAFEFATHFSNFNRDNHQNPLPAAQTVKSSSFLARWMIPTILRLEAQQPPPIIALKIHSLPFLHEPHYARE
jgi:hypothetical protein